MVHISDKELDKIALREKFLYSEFFWYVFSRIRTDTPYLYVFSPNVGKYRPEKPRIRTLFTQCRSFNSCDTEAVAQWCSKK